MAIAEDGLKMLLNLKERDESDKNSTADYASRSDFNLTFSGMGDGSTSDVADMERRGKNDTKKCLNDVVSFLYLFSQRLTHTKQL